MDEVSGIFWFLLTKRSTLATNPTEREGTEGGVRNADCI